MMDEKANQAIHLQINKLKNLPVLPEVSLSILKAVNEPEIETDELAKILSMSPSLVARLIGLANSAYFGQSREIRDLTTAIYKVLGRDLVKSLTLAIVLNVQLNTNKCQAFNSQYFWLRSLLTAMAAQKIAMAGKYTDLPPAMAYTGGLLLYSGMLVLGYLMPEELNGLFLRCEKNKISVGDEIKREFGNSHYHLGRLLLQKWQLPVVYQSVMQHFEDTGYAGTEKRMIDLLTLSQGLSSMLLDGELTDIQLFAGLAETLSLSPAVLSDIFDKLIEDREKFEKLAEIIGH